MSDHPVVPDAKLFSSFPTAQPYPTEDDAYQGHLLEQYKVYVAMADKISDRRQAANSYFLAVNSALLAFLGYAIPKGSTEYLWLVGLAGMTLSYLWYRIVRSYRDLNSAKFLVIQQIETRLPLQSFQAEWVAVGEGKNPSLYKPVTHVEMGVPWVFFVLHAFVVLKTFPWHAIAVR
jgi:hypothetical protein